MKRREFLKGLGVLGGAGVVGSVPGAEARAAQTASGFKTKHMILIINGNGARKLDYYEQTATGPNGRRMADAGTVCTEDHNDTIFNHGFMYTELLMGQDISVNIPVYPTIPHYIRKVHNDEATQYWYVQGTSMYRAWRFSDKYLTTHPDFGIQTRPVSLTTQAVFYEENKRSPAEIVRQNFPDDMDVTSSERKRLEEFIEGHLNARDYTPSTKRPTLYRTPFLEEQQALHMVPKILAAFKPRLIILQINGHDTGHGGGSLNLEETGYDDYLKVINYTDELLGDLLDFVEGDPYFSQNTAIVMRPECGRDDETTIYHELHHSPGYYQSHRSASIFYGPDFKSGHVVKDVVHRLDMCPTIVKMFGADANFAKGSVRSQIFEEHVGALPAYEALRITNQG